MGTTRGPASMQSLKDSTLESGILVRRGMFIGRYVILGRVGRGAMGEVHAAYDPELDRKVAIKVLRIKRGSHQGAVDSKSRLLREAQAIARVSHPNVVMVHDVGSNEDSVFIAMEYIDGCTLSYWLHASPRSWREILRVFVGAGRGREAAHAANLVHRDFKPDNVMVRKDGQVRVMDFGLVRHAADVSEPETPGPELAAADPFGAAAAATPAPAMTLAGLFHDKLTQTGAMMGTPAYMAPEQFKGHLADARSDQFSFCLALHEALYGERPFSGASLAELATNVVHGKAKAPPERARVPNWVRRALRRGLSIDPAARYPSMQELLADLEPPPPFRARFLVGALASLVAAALAAQGAGSHQRVSCRAPEQQFDGVWESSGWRATRRNAIQAAFRATGKDYAAASFGSVARVLDRYVDDWSKMYIEACEATNVSGHQSAEVLDLRMGCLGDRFGELRALSDLLVAPSGDVVENAAQAAMSLGPLDRCADTRILRGTLPPPASPSGATAIQVVRADLAAAKAQEEAGHLSGAASALVGIVANARETGYRPLVAEALYQLGSALLADGQGGAAEVPLMEAVSEAQASHHDEVLIEAMTALVTARGTFAHDVAGAELWRRLAEASLERIGGNERLQAHADAGWAGALEAAGRLEEALEAQQTALGHMQRAVGPTAFDVGLVLAQISGTYAKMGLYEQALSYNDRALSITEAALGRNHPHVGTVLVRRAEIVAGLGRFYESKENAERAYDLWSRNLSSPDHPLLALPLSEIGIAELGLGHPQRAVSPLGRALKLAEGGKIPMSLTDARFALARALWSTHQDRRGAVAQARAALAEVTALERPTPRERALRAAIEEWYARAGAEAPALAEVPAPAGFVFPGTGR